GPGESLASMMYQGAATSVENKNIRKDNASSLGAILSIVDVKGRRVAGLERLPGGVYFARFATNSMVIEKKLVLVK
ncbi:MAG: hypothetical protein PHC61_15465, partial [Chitinivibrionales bacterium]|nr:hypothetical protein [Chitinivibrionales bacterium]